MSIKPMDMNNIYLRMGEVSRERDKEIKKEEKEQSFQKRIHRFREEIFDHTVNQVRKSHADQTVKEHEERALPEPPKHSEVALPMATIATPNESTYRPTHSLDPDLGHHIDIER